MLMYEWASAVLSQYAKVMGGYAFKSADFQEYGEYPVIKIKNIASGKLNMADCQYISAHTSEQAQRFKAKKGDILIAMTGSHITQPSSMVGRVTRYNTDIEAYINQRVGKIYSLDCDLFDEDFLYHFMVQEDTAYSLANIASGSANQANISATQIENLSLLLPNIDEQRAVAEILTALDDKIDLLIRQNATLEILAQTYFRQWFVESPKSEWTESNLDEIADFLNGLALQKYPYRSGESFFVVKIKEMKNGFSDNTDLCSTDVPERYIVSVGDVIFSWSGSLEVDIWKYDKGALNQHLFKVTSEQYPNWFYYYWIKEHMVEFRIIAESKATTMGHIQRGHLSVAKVLIPTDEEMDAMNEIMFPLITKIERNNEQIRTLQKLRDTLLPKLISGKARVKVDDL
jgi:type I restriction enzyme S subunit